MANSITITKYYKSLECLACVRAETDINVRVDIIRSPTCPDKRPKRQKI